MLMKGNGKISEYIVDFNEIEDKEYSHIVVFVNQNDESKFYHILPSKNERVIKQDIDELLAEDIKIIEIWKLEVNEQLQKRLSVILDSMSSQKVSYDFKFDYKTDDKLYCSEFVSKALYNLDSEKFNFKTRKKEVNNPILKGLIGKDTIDYVPVDFFVKHQSFKRIK